MDTPLPPSVGSQYMMDGRVYEIINLTPELVSLRDVDGKRAQYLALEDFERLLFCKEIILYQSAPLQQSNAIYFLDSNAPRVIRARRKYFYVEGLRKAFSDRLPREACASELKKLAVQYGDAKPPSYSSVWEWSRRCRQHGGSPFSLLKLKSQRPRGKITAEDTSHIIRRYIDEAYLSDQKPTVAHVYKLICGQIIHDNILRRENNARCIATPSLSTVYRRIHQRCRLLQDTRRLGVRRAQKNNKFGIKWAEPSRLLEQVELDSTPLDLQLVDVEGEPMGRIGHLQAAIEVKSGKIIAYDLSLTPPCAEKTLRVFKMALTAVEGEELQRGKMQELIVDNGTEVANETVRVAAEVLGIQLRYVPPNTPDAKPHIERFFETLNSSFTHTLPGTTFSNPIARGDYDSAAKACFTIEQVQAYFRTWLEGYYHNHSPSNTKQSPNAIWDREMAKQFPPQKYAQKDLDHLTRRIERRRINGGRVSILNLSWTGPGLAEMENRLRPGKRAIIYYDASNLAEVFVALPERPDELFRGVGTWPAYQEHLTHYEHLLVQQRLKDRGEQLTERVALLALWQLRKELSAAEIDFITRKRKRPAPKPNHQVRLTPPAEPSPSSRDFDNVCTAQEDYATFYLSDQNT